MLFHTWWCQYFFLHPKLWEDSLGFHEYFQRWFNHLLVSIPKLQQNNHWTSGTVRGMRTTNRFFWAIWEAAAPRKCEKKIRIFHTSSQFQAFWSRCSGIFLGGVGDIRFVWFHMFKNLIKKKTLPKKIRLEYPEVLHPRIPRRPDTYRYTKIPETDRWPKKK